MRGKVDWSKPVYVTSVASSSTRKMTTHRCCECGNRILVGERFKRGPRGRENIHEACVPKWAAKNGNR